MKHKELKDIIFKKVVWTIKNLGTLEPRIWHRSEVFSVRGRAWTFYFYNGGSWKMFSLGVADVQSLPQGWSIYAAFTFTVVNQASPENSVKQDFNKKFSANDGTSFYLFSKELDEFLNTDVFNDKCIVEVEFSEVNSEGTQVVGQIIEKALVTEEDDVVVDFKDLGKIEKSFVPLLEEVCSWHPSLLDGKENKSRRFTEWAFTALGQVLQFLKNKKWKDMNEKACEDLQHLWEELEMSRLDLSWLEPLVKSAINMKGYDEKVDKVKKMKQNLVMLETEINMIKEKLVLTEQSIEMLRKELINAVEDFEEKDLEAKIGYGKPQ